MLRTVMLELPVRSTERAIVVSIHNLRASHRMRSGAPDPEITRLLASAGSGDTTAMNRLVPLIYDDLRAIAHRRISLERVGHTLNTTAVVHEAYVRLVEGEQPEWRDRVHFFAVASKVMRHILIDYARLKRASKRGGSAVRVTLNEEHAAEEDGVLDVLELNDVLEKLAEHDPRLEQVVECRFFGGMSMEETAEAMAVSVRTATRDWRRARAYLYDALHP